MIINLVYENTFIKNNFIKCKDINKSNIKRFTPSPLIKNLISNDRLIYDISNRPRNYIIESGVNHHPNDWTGSNLYEFNIRRSCFSYLNKKYLSDARKGRAMILLDQSLEGYHTSWLWDYFHKDCINFEINPKCVIYVTGNLLAEEQYKTWADNNNIIDRLNIIPYVHFEKDIFQLKHKSGIITVDDHLEYKKNNNIKTFNCLQKRLRPHRIWIYKYLSDFNLINEGLISMNKFKSSMSFMENRSLTDEETQLYNKELPLLIYNKNNNEFPDSYYINRIIDQVFLDTWVSVISEASFNDDALFLSEKTFKAIVCKHPFIIAGNKNSLSKLRDLGYKTFDGFIDESYDDLDTFDRLNSIMISIKKISEIPNKLEWYKSMEDILNHNYENLKKNSNYPIDGIEKLKNCYVNYFKR